MFGGFLEKQTSFSWSVKTDPWALHAVLLSHFQAPSMERSQGFYPHREPAWNLSLSIFTHSPIQTILFSHQPHNEGFVLVLFVHLWHLFWDCSLSCRQHAAYANTRSFIREFPPLNECSLKWGHTFCRGGSETCAWNSRRVLHAPSDVLSLRRWREPTLFWASAHPDRWREKRSKGRGALATVTFSFDKCVTAQNVWSLTGNTCIFSRADTDLKRESKLVGRWQVFIHLIKELKTLT